jgi:hypothetical protein
MASPPKHAIGLGNACALYKGLRAVRFFVPNSPLPPDICVPFENIYPLILSMPALRNQTRASRKSPIKLVPATAEDYRHSQSDSKSDSFYDDTQPEDIEQPWSYVFQVCILLLCTLDVKAELRSSVAIMFG